MDAPEIGDIIFLLSRPFFILRRLFSIVESKGDGDNSGSSSSLQGWRVVGCLGVIL